MDKLNIHDTNDLLSRLGAIAYISLNVSYIKAWDVSLGKNIDHEVVASAFVSKKREKWKDKSILFIKSKDLILLVNTSLDFGLYFTNWNSYKNTGGALLSEYFYWEIFVKYICQILQKKAFTTWLVSIFPLKALIRFAKLLYVSSRKYFLKKRRVVYWSFSYQILIRKNITASKKGIIHIARLIWNKLLSYLKFSYLRQEINFKVLCCHIHLCIVMVYYLYTNYDLFLSITVPHTAWKMSVFGVVLVRIQSEFGKIQIRAAPNKDAFYTVLVMKQKASNIWWNESVLLLRLKDQERICENLM